ncbi:alcohol dehydrogenase, class IV [Halobacteroides halobius DSM 5150]|uniref:Aldehyde-alcohol dehydrogenase n=1 Tax=Halobacteroides halobius (strain ATCC 35273 / DSM 5150 / MD-1) TaxID=748449 RepID=L0K7G4_HALHC|nr:bifunctional acetaldehyde-CoA/alcohol dehydrogenase [Halobacteroides halobius]AGB40063.1 alcohol dehydrogenase, class IV [Halobacteroides halobius DSM 5150]
MAVQEKEVQHRSEAQEMVDGLISKAQKAQKELAQMNQEEIDQIVEEMVLAGVDKHIELAKLAVEDTGMGVYEDKIAKNIFSTEYIYNDIKDKKTVGVLEENKVEGTVKIAEPVGVIAGITPTTNPTSTTMFKALTALKAGNSIVFSFHPSALECSAKSAQILHDAAVKAGAPEGCISWISEPSLEATNALMKHDGVDMILATGGAGMVKAAYSSGTPALGVGPGNVPAYVEKSVNLKQAINDIVMSKSFDNGTICASEQAIILDKEIAEEAKGLLVQNHCYMLDEKEIKKVEEVAIDKERNAMSPEVVGQSATKIAQLAGIDVPKDTVVLVAPINGVGPDYPLSREKLSPILALIEVEDSDEGIQKAIEMTEFGGLGHSAVIHSNDDKVIEEFGNKLQVGRVIVNAPSALGGIGDIYNNFAPSLTLGCGTFGGNAVSENVTVDHLYNVKTVAKRKTERLWVKVPPEIYTEAGSLAKLADEEGKKAAIITDQVMVDLGYVDQVTEYLEEAGVDYRVFDEVEPDPSVETVMKGKDFIEEFGADTIIALGGGSPMDAAKGMWLFYEHPEAKFRDLKLRFADIKKRTYEFPNLGEKAKFIAVPTTSGTGSEVTAFAVITDKKNDIKYPLASYELTPDMAIIDSDLTMTVPASVTANTGIDVLTHAIEAYVATLSSDYTDALALQAIRMVFKYLPRAYKNGQQDREAREKMHNASCMAGIAFTNAFLGINHSLAHILGGKFHIPHGLANGVLMPHVIRYNAATPTKWAIFPNYRYHKADEEYAEIARNLGLEANTPEEGVENLVEAIKDLMKELDMPLTIADCDIEWSDFEEKISEMADVAFNDQCTPANPRKPRVSELEEIYKKAYGDRK